ncbi:MAG: zf-HC2 domain-containing protein [Candidatus Marinimicrobia bacterium]|nr:zf-HC2 domain-containing protein [Candidatus Neomarinimicrobiota bacterium]MBL7009711.1 zf-HC2 domain-containing protein [Candidatus Neomarinimicrobiota bacterium]MBL7029546.1 zf-HC2 domain-containing protein [Candidatus Neomarinimicrobiota bacterium]
MTVHHHNKDLLEKLQKQFGKDIDAEILEDVSRHMKECPDCKIYVDSVQQTVKIYRVTETEKLVPEDVSERLFKTLKLHRNPS